MRVSAVAFELFLYEIKREPSFTVGFKPRDLAAVLSFSLTWSAGLLVTLVRAPAASSHDFRDRYTPVAGDMSHLIQATKTSLKCVTGLIKLLCRSSVMFKVDCELMVLHNNHRKT